MSSNFNFTFIVGYRDNVERLQNLRRVLDWINDFDKVEVIIVEQDTHSKISHLNLKAKHIFTESNTLFNRSKAFNVGLKHSTSDIIVFGDSDMVMDKKSFIEGLDSMKEFEMCSPFFTLIDLGKKESLLPFEEIYQVDRLGRGHTYDMKYPLPLCAGICIFRKDAIEKIGGWNEDFVGWGGEDNFQSIKVKNFLTWTELGHKCFHLNHEIDKTDMEFYLKNVQLVDEALRMNKAQLNDLISSQKLQINK